MLYTSFYVVSWMSLSVEFLLNRTFASTPREFIYLYVTANTVEVHFIWPHIMCARFVEFLSFWTMLRDIACSSTIHFSSVIMWGTKRNRMTVCYSTISI